MPKKWHDLAKKLKGKKGVKNPFALAHSILQKKGEEKPA